MSKKMSENFTELGLQSYYKSLTKSEKSSLIEYLMVKFGYRYASLQSKLSGKHFLNKRDLILIGARTFYFDNGIDFLTIK